jgi:hypothetical protein
MNHIVPASVTFVVFPTQSDFTADGMAPTPNSFFFLLHLFDRDTNSCCEFFLFPSALIGSIRLWPFYDRGIRWLASQHLAEMPSLLSCRFLRVYFDDCCPGSSARARDAPNIASFLSYAPFVSLVRFQRSLVLAWILLAQGCIPVLGFRFRSLAVNELYTLVKYIHECFD